MEFFPKEWTEYMPTDGLSKDGKGVQKYDGYHIDKKHNKLKDQDIIDWHSVDYCIDRIKGKKGDQDKPFFLACGLYKPHLAFVAPRKYYKDFPLESIELPPHREDDLNDIPLSGIKMAGPGGDHRKFLKSGRWKAAIQSYLATVAYTDMNVGRLLDALNSSSKRKHHYRSVDRSWLVTWRKKALAKIRTLGGNHPYTLHLGGTGHDEPRHEVQPTGRFDEPISYPVRTCRYRTPSYLVGHSIVPLLKIPEHYWEHPAITTYGSGNHAVRTETHRYIRYANGEEELYHNEVDPYEWTNLAKNKKYTGLKNQLAKYIPKKEIAPAPRK